MMDIIKSYFQKELDLHPSYASFIGFSKYNDRIENFLSEDIRNINNKIDIEYYNKALLLNNKNNIQIQSFLYYLKNSIELNKSKLWLMPLSSYDNIITSLVRDDVEFYNFKTKKDIINAVKRYSVFPEIVKSCILLLKKGIENNMVIPKFICENIIIDLEKYIKLKLYIHSEIKNNEYENILKDSILDLIDFLKNTYVHKCRNTIGICHLPNGKNIYKKLVRDYSTLKITPEEIYKYGLEEVTRIKQELKNIKDILGYDPIKSKENYAKTKTELINIFKEKQKIIIRDIMHEKFEYQLKNHISLKITPKNDEKNSAGAYYYSGNYTQKRKGKFFINTGNLKSIPLNTILVLSLHESEPGHHYQFQYMIENNIPIENIFLFQSTGFIEGWGLYSESLYDNYSDTEKYGKLTFEILRAVRLVVDVGVHYYGWSFNKAFKYMKDNIPSDEDSLRIELIRYITIPGQAVCYKLGERFFKMKQKEFLKKGGNIKDFHTLVLKNGILPLELLDKII